VSDTEEFSDKFVCMGPFPPGLAPKKLAVVRYTGKLEHPQWVDLEPGQCVVFTMTEGSLTCGDHEQTTMRLCVML